MYDVGKSIIIAAQNGVSVPETELSHAKEAVMLYEKILQSASQYVIPPLQSPIDVYNFISYKNAIDEAVPVCGDFLPKTNVVIGSLEYMDVNAWVAKVNEKEYLIVLNSGLLNAISIITNILTVTIGQDGGFPGGMGIINETKLDEAAKIFFGLVKKYVFYLTPEDYDNFYLEWHTKLEEQWLLMETFSKMFVLSHEYSHLLLGHLEEKENLVPLAIAPGVDELVKQRRHELAADLLAFQLLIFTNKSARSYDTQGFGDSVIVAWISSVVFFEIIHVFELARQIAGIETFESSHPGARERVDNILTFVRNKGTDARFLGHLQELEGRIRNCFTAYWGRTVNDISQCARENKTKIHRDLLPHSSQEGLSSS